MPEWDGKGIGRETWRLCLGALKGRPYKILGATTMGYHGGGVCVRVLGGCIQRCGTAVGIFPEIHEGGLAFYRGSI